MQVLWGGQLLRSFKSWPVVSQMAARIHISLSTSTSAHRSDGEIRQLSVSEAVENELAKAVDDLVGV